jgi:hypothetical protein
MIELMGKHSSLNHFLCASGKRFQERLEAMIHHMAPQRSFGIDDFDLHDKTTITIQSSLQKKEVLTRLSRYAVRLAGFNEFAETVETIAWEIVSNAIFNAPVDRSNGQRKYIALPREQILDLNEDEFVKVEFGVDGEFLVLSIKDQFGLLDRSTIVDNLVRCSQKGENQMRTAPGGAGLGMYMVLNMASQLDFYVKPKVSTEVVCLINFSKRQKDYEEYGTSLNMFFED